MLNNNFLKTLTILYVEDEQVAREQLAKALKRIFKEVITAVDGEDGYEKYNEHKQTIDLILSDINMPRLNGIEMLEKIRKTDGDIPFIFTTARSETEYLLKAIELNVNHYALKPVNIEDIIQRINTVCQKTYFEKKLADKQDELKNYTKAIENVALVLKMDIEGKVTFANASFLETSLYSTLEIVELTFDNIVHTEAQKDLFQTILYTIETQNSWEGNEKFITKNSEDFYLKFSMFKINSLDQNEYMMIGFLTTKENIEKREFRKKVILNQKEHKEQEANLQKEVNLYKDQLQKLKDIILPIEEKLKEEKKKNIILQKQLYYYEEKVHSIDDKKSDFFKQANSRVHDLSEAYKKIKKENETAITHRQKLEEQVEASREEMQKLYASLDERDKRLLKFEDIIKYRESQLMMIDPKLLSQ